MTSMVNLAKNENFPETVVKRRRNATRRQWHSRGEGEEGMKFYPLSDPGALVRSGLSSIGNFHCQHSMEINNLHALEGPCHVLKGQFETSGGPSKDQESPSKA